MGGKKQKNKKKKKKKEKREKEKASPDHPAAGNPPSSPRVQGCQDPATSSAGPRPRGVCQVRGAGSPHPLTNPRNHWR